MLILNSIYSEDWVKYFNQVYIYIYFILAYVYGSIPYGLVVARIFYHTDLRNKGSGNIGATNATRILGKKAGFMTLILDGTKPIIIVLLANYFYSDNYMPALIGGVICLLAHTKSIFLKFKGGKGVACFFGLLLILDLRIFLSAAVSWIIVYFITKNSGIAASLSFLILPITIYQFQSNIIFWLLLFVCFYIISLHYKNVADYLNK